MTINIATLRDNAKTLLGAIAGLRLYDTIPDSVNVPCAVVSNVTMTWDETMGRGLDNADFEVMVIVSRMSERAGQDKLDALLAGSGASSVKTALEAGVPPRSLSGAVSTMQVTRATPIAVTIGSIEYLAYRFEVTSYG